MVRIDDNDISDEEFDNIVIPFENTINLYIKEKILNEFVAYFIAEGYNFSSIWNENVDNIINTACEYLTNFNNKDCNKKIIKEILIKKYKLKIIDENKLEIIEL